MKFGRNFVQTYDNSSAFSHQWHEFMAVFSLCIWKHNSTNSHLYEVDYRDNRSAGVGTVGLNPSHGRFLL